MSLLQRHKCYAVLHCESQKVSLMQFPVELVLLDDCLKRGIKYISALKLKVDNIHLHHTPSFISIVCHFCIACQLDILYLRSLDIAIEFKSFRYFQNVAWFSSTESDSAGRA